MHDALTRSMRASHVLLAILVTASLIVAAIGAALDDTFYLRLATEALIFGGLALSVDILVGYTGLLSLGQALYFGLGAYLSALVLMVVPSFWTAIAVTALASAVAGLIGGFIVNRVRGVYFALITFGMAQVAAKIVYTRVRSAPRRIDRLPVIDIHLGVATVSSASPAGFFLLVLALIVIMYAVAAYLLDTPFGRLLIALRANEARIPFLGYRTMTPRLAAYVLAAMIASLSGALYPMLRGFVSPELMYFATSGNAVITVVTGGAGTLVGALYGSALLTLLKSVIGSYTVHHLIVIGILFMSAVIFLPKGMIGSIRPAVERMLARREQK